MHLSVIYFKNNNKQKFNDYNVEWRKISCVEFVVHESAETSSYL